MAGHDRGPAAVPGGLRAAFAVLRAVGLVVPGGARERWVAEWRAELWYALRIGRYRFARVLPALPHALALRWQESRPDMFAYDLRQALRQFRDAPGFALLVVLTLGVGIGANSLVFGILQSTVIAPLAAAEADRIVYLWRAHPQEEMRISVQRSDLRAWQESVDGLEQIHGMAIESGRLSGPIEAQRMPMARATAGLFPLLGVEPTLGRGFTAEDELGEGAAVIVLAHGLWRSAFGADPDVVGTSVLVKEVPHVIVGVLPPEFRLQAPYNDVRAWRPLGHDAEPRGLTAIGKLAAGVPVEVVDDQLRAIDLENAPDGWVADAQRPRDFVAEGYRTIVWLFQGAVALVLAIACANIANLMLARGSRRRREMAVRAAIGAGRGRLVRQLLIESLVLSLLGGLLGLGVAAGGVGLLERLRPEQMRYLETLRFDPAVFALTAALAVGCGLLFGLVPAFQTSGLRLTEGLADGGRGAGDGRASGSVRSTLVVAEVALSTLLLIGAGLLVATFLAYQGTEPGFEPEGVLSVRVSLPESGYEDAASRTLFWNRLVGDLRTALGPRAEAVAVASGIPPRVGVTFGRPEIEDGVPAQPEALLELSSYVSGEPAMFEVLGVNFRQGGPATAPPDAETPVVINRTFAQRLWGTEQVVGRGLRTGGESWLRVVGVIDDVKAFGLATSRGEQQIFEVQGPADDDYFDSQFVLARADDPLTLVPTLREVVQGIEPDAVADEIALASDLMGESIALQRFNAQLMAGLAGLALTLALIGIYGVLSYSVARRVPELGLRMALGADPGRVRRMVVREGGVLIGVGLLAGLLGATWASGFLASQLHGVAPIDATTYGLAALLLGTVGLAACTIPAWRATRVDPKIALDAS